MSSQLRVEPLNFLSSQILVVQKTRVGHDTVRGMAPQYGKTMISCELGSTKFTYFCFKVVVRYDGP